MERPNTRKPYRELQRKLVLAFDVGTTFSGASFVLLDPGQVPIIKGVTRFPGQQQVGGNSKIPTIVRYDSSGNVLTAGDEAAAMQHEEVNDDEDSDDEAWDEVNVKRTLKVEWFKLHLRPKTLSAAHIADDDLPPLPPNKTAIDVFADFLEYLYKCTKTFFEESMPSGQSIWEALEASGQIEFVLTHPNGWEGAQQAQMREAAVRAGLVSDSRASRDRVHFVTEGEASLHFCINEGVVSRESLPIGEGVIIVDAGGGTIDLSAYQWSQSGESFVEMARAACLLQGSVMVRNRAKAWLREDLQGSKYADEVDRMTELFDNGAKLAFKNPENSSLIRFGMLRDRDPKFGIKSGQKTIPGSVMASFFEPSIRETVQALQKQRQEAGGPIKTALLVGGFAASDWLFSEIKNSLEPMGIALARPDGHVNKAVADGAVSYYLDHFVSARVSKMSYGVTVNTRYQASDPGHLQRAHTVYKNPAGQEFIPGVFSEILPKGTQVSTTREYRRSFNRRAFYRNQLCQVTDSINCYRGEETCPRWTDDEPNMFSAVCSVRSNVSEMAAELPTLSGVDGRLYYSMTYDIVLSFGLTELQAQIAWIDSNGNEKRSPAQIIYDNND